MGLEGLIGNEEPDKKPPPPKEIPDESILSEETDYKDGLKNAIIGKWGLKKIVNTYLQELDMGVDDFLSSFVDYCFVENVNYSKTLSGIDKLLEIHANILGKEGRKPVVPKKSKVSTYKKQENYYR